ncbi:MAG: hypothetical protein IKE41_04285 [Clostridia bacterium]|nr:hypothetical protein [Clostridia bacterium]
MNKTRIGNVMKHTFLYFVLIFALCFAACEKPEQVYCPGWEGEYTVSYSRESVYNSGSIESVVEYGESTLTIFNNNGLYVQTWGVGDPFNPDVDLHENLWYAQSPARNEARKDSIDNTTDSTGIENVTVDGKSVIIMQNGGVYTMYNGVKVSPNPIRVKSAKENELVLVNGKYFDVTLTDPDGRILMIVRNHWEYGPIQKKDDCCVWDFELHMDSGVNSSSASNEMPTIYRYHYVFRKK